MFSVPASSFYLKCTLFICLILGAHTSAETVTFGNWDAEGVLSNNSQNQSATITQDDLTFELLVETSPGNIRLNNSSDRMSVLGGLNNNQVDEGASHTDGSDDESISFQLNIIGERYSEISLNSIEINGFTGTNERVEFSDGSVEINSMILNGTNTIIFNYDGAGGANSFEELEPLAKSNLNSWKLKLKAIQANGSATSRFNISSISFNYNPQFEPVANDLDFEVETGSILTQEAPGVLSNDVDFDEDTLTVILVSDVAYGTLNLLSDGSFTYAPIANYIGNDSFSYKVNDGKSDSNIATVTLSIGNYTANINHYYIDALSGNDANNGNSEVSAWKTLAQANNQNFNPGTRILLKRGQTHTGFLDLSNEKGSGLNPIIVSDYGISANRALLNATGEASAISLNQSEYIEIENIEIAGAGIRGTAFNWNSSGKIWNHYHFRNLSIHDTIGSGIQLYVSNLGGYTYKDISITDCVIENASDHGITINKWAGEGVYTIKNISAPDAARTAGTYLNVTAINSDSTQIIPAEFTVIVDSTGAASINVSEKGAGYNVNDNLIITDDSLGNGGAVDLSFQIQRTEPAEANEFYHEDLIIRNNTITNVDAAGIQIGKMKNAVIENNIVTNPGRDYDKAGSGLWTWYCGTPSTTFLVQRNSFTGSQGDTDSCGAHIDIGCINNIYQYNLSRENQGGFMEILGRSSNNVYRYNISINDGIREKTTEPYQADGRTLFLGGYTGQNGPQLGPYNNYIYNNTIYTRAEIVSKYSMAASASGALFANNIIYVAGTTEDVTAFGDSGEAGTNLIFQNNLVSQNKVPTTPFTQVLGTIDADPQFAMLGGLEPENYTPTNHEIILDNSIDIYNLPGDNAGIAGGFTVTEDYFGNPIIGQADIGAIEATTIIHWLDDNSLSTTLDITDSNSYGVRYLEAYSFNLNPNTAAPNQLPHLSLSNNGNSLEYKFYGLATNVFYQLEESEDLQTWTTWDMASAPPPNNNGMVTIDWLNPENSQSKFIRLKLSIED
jgi:hypothetical protein